MIGFLALTFGLRWLIGEEADERERQTRIRNTPKPGLSSQAAQIKPLTSAQLALGKKAYLGPRRKRK